MKMYKDGMTCNADKSQLAPMEAGGWSRKAPEVEEVEAAPEVVEEEVEVEEEETPEVEEKPAPQKDTSLKTTPRAVKKRKPIAKKKAGEE